MSPRAGLPFIAALLLLAALQASGSPTAEAAPTANQYSVAPIIPDGYLGANGSAVIEFAMIPGRPNEAIVVQQAGYIWRVAMDGSFAPTLWGDVHTKLTCCGEQGLLAVAFSPDFATSGRVYLYYTPGSPTPTVLARYSATPTDLNESSEEVLLTFEEFATNHNGGHIAFDSDGLLYFSMGDGGGANDPQEKAQDLTTMLGKVIRIDVSGAGGYTIPADNPFRDGTGPMRDEIFAYGFRNPFRMTIDQQTDEIWLGDVGQGAWEEVNRVILGGNYGWDCYEGNDVREPAGCPPSGFQFPRTAYDHNFGQAVTGGGIYRGSDMPELYGWYVYGDFYSGRIWAVNPADSSPAIQIAQPALNISSFTVLPDGELAVVSYDAGVYRLTSRDADGDSVVAFNDNCPDWPNTSQNQPPWPIPNDDADCDGWSRVREDFVGTDPASHCGSTPTRHDEPDDWPTDFDDNRVTNIGDYISFNVRIGARPGDANYDPRWDLNMNQLINVQDVLHLNPFMFYNCSTT
jgi:glucose/arabinose dehydrogenase